METFFEIPLSNDSNKFNLTPADLYNIDNTLKNTKYRRDPPKNIGQLDLYLKSYDTFNDADRKKIEIEICGTVFKRRKILIKTPLLSQTSILYSITYSEDTCSSCTFSKSYSQPEGCLIGCFTDNARVRNSVRRSGRFRIILIFVNHDASLKMYASDEIHNIPYEKRHKNRDDSTRTSIGSLKGQEGRKIAANPIPSPNNSLSVFRKPHMSQYDTMDEGIDIPLEEGDLSFIISPNAIISPNNSPFNFSECSQDDTTINISESPISNSSIGEWPYSYIRVPPNNSPSIFPKYDKNPITLQKMRSVFRNCFPPDVTVPSNNSPFNFTLGQDDRMDMGNFLETSEIISPFGKYSCPQMTIPPENRPFADCEILDSGSTFDGFPSGEIYTIDSVFDMLNNHQLKLGLFDDNVFSF